MGIVKAMAHDLYHYPQSNYYQSPQALGEGGIVALIVTSHFLSFRLISICGYIKAMMAAVH